MLPLIFACLAASLFAVSLGLFLYAYFFLWGPYNAALAVNWDHETFSRIAINSALFSAFALHHSLFARTGLKRVVTALFGSAERSFYTFVSSVLFIIVCLWWQRIPGVLWMLTGLWRWVGYAAIVAGIVITAMGARVLDIFDLAGVRQALASRAPSAARQATALKTDGVYGFVRHPLYFAWFLLVFGAPRMSMTRFSFAVVSTLYLAIAIPLEEQGLVETFGTEYASYRKKVRWRMLPGIY